MEMDETAIINFHKEATERGKAKILEDAWFSWTCQMLLSYKDADKIREYLKLFSDCLEKDINPALFVQIGMQLAEHPVIKHIGRESRARQDYHEKGKRFYAQTAGENRGLLTAGTMTEFQKEFTKWAEKEVFHPDEKIAFLNIFLNRYLDPKPLSLDESMRSLAIETGVMNPDEKYLANMKRRYFRLISKMYGIAETRHWNPALEFPKVFNPILLNRGNGYSKHNVPKRHMFKMTGKKRNPGYMIYLRNKNEYWLMEGSIICRNFTKTGSRYLRCIPEDSVTPYGKDFFFVRRPIQVHSPSCAASLMLGTQVSGMTRWTNYQYQTIKEILSKEQAEDEK